MSTDQSRSKRVFLSIIAPVFNESGSITPFLERTLTVLSKLSAPLGPGLTCEILFVDDGSTDATLAELLMARQMDSRIRILSLSRNFGKDTALAAGLAYASGLAVIPIDVDLQDPPEVIPKMVEQWLGGFDVVVACRANRQSDSWMKRNTAGLFYRVFNKLADRPIIPNAGDFRLLSRRVVDVLNELPERARFMKGLFGWVGFSHTTVEYVREKRHTGSTKWRYWRLWNFAIDGITSSTTAPLRVWTYLGALTACLAVAYAGVLAGRTLIFGADVPGYASLMVAILLFGALNLLSLGIVGEYLGRIHTEVKGRPLYVVRETYGLQSKVEVEASTDAEKDWVELGSLRA